MSMSFVRRFYGVPAKRGRLVAWQAGYNQHIGRITSAPGQYLRISGRGPFHPTWGLVYLDETGNVMLDTRKHGESE
jgi:hypothetical protein